MILESVPEALRLVSMVCAVIVGGVAILPPKRCIAGDTALRLGLTALSVAVFYGCYDLFHAAALLRPAFTACAMVLLTVGAIQVHRERTRQ